MLRLLKYLFVSTMLLAIALPIVAVVAGLQPEPVVPVRGGLTSGDIERAQALIERYDPREEGPRTVRSLVVPERDITRMLSYGVGRLFPAGAHVNIRNRGATISLTGQVPENPLGRYINLRLDLSQIPGAIRIDGLRFGDLQVPGFLADWIGWAVHGALNKDESYRALLASINGFRLADDRLTLVYQWQPDLLDQVRSRGRSLLVGEADRDRLLAYAERIAAATQDSLFGRKMALPEMLGPVFEEAQDRTRAGGEAAVENRAAIIALMLYIQGVDIPRLLDVPADERYWIDGRTLTLKGRDDFAQHFLISAGIAASGGSQLADAVGLFKEMDDSRGGSGFSFTDLAADRAGVRFAETATGPASARVQSTLAGGARESDFMPEVGDLPEFMAEAEFVRRYGGVGAPAYKRIASDIDQRIAALAIHR